MFIEIISNIDFFSYENKLKIKNICSLSIGYDRAWVYKIIIKSTIYIFFKRVNYKVDLRNKLLFEIFDRREI